MSDKLLVLRTMIHLSQQDLAEIIGVSRQTVVAMETKKRSNSWNVFLVLALFFSKNQDTSQLLELYGIYTDDLENSLLISK